MTKNKKTPSKKTKKINFRKFETKSGKKVLAGKTAENNEKLVKQAKKNEYILHTAAPGSPFVNIKNNRTKVTKKDIKEAAIFCATYSRDWKKNKSNVEVHVFKKADVYKEKDMKIGTFGVKKHKTIIIKKKEIGEFEKEGK